MFTKDFSCYFVASLSIWLFVAVKNPLRRRVNGKKFAQERNAVADLENSSLNGKSQEDYYRLYELLVVLN